MVKSNVTGIQDIIDYVSEDKHLPIVIRDKASQRLLVTAISRIMEKVIDSKEIDELDDYIAAFIFDTFLTAMATMGYTLQKNRKVMNYVDLDSVIKHISEQAFLNDGDIFK